MLWLMEIGLVVFVIWKIAESESRSPIIWAAISLVLCILASMVIPIAPLAPLAGGLATFIAMLVANATRG